MEFMLNLHKRAQENRVKGGLVVACHDIHGHFVGQGGFVYPFADQGVIDVGNGHQPAGQRDRLALQAAGVTAAVEAFVVRAADLLGAAEKSRVLPRHLFEVADDRLAVEGVLLHEGEFLWREPAGLQQNAVRDAHLADIVEWCALVQDADVFPGELLIEIGRASCRERV